MAKKKKSKESSATSSYSVELIGLILILIGIIGFGFGFVGSLIKKFAMFLAGSWWIVILIFTIILGIYMLYKRKMPKFTSGKLIGLYLIFIIILVASHFEFLNLADSPGDIFSETYNNFMERISSISANNALETSGTTSVVIGGGFIGATFITLLYSLFGKTGSIVILVILGIFAAVLTFNVNLSNIFSKIFGIFKHKKKEKKEVSSDEVITTNSNEEVKEEPKQDKIVITSMDELKQKPIEQESLEPKKRQEDIYESTTYTLPKFNEIFDPIKQKKINSTEFTKSNKEILERVLRDFGVNAKVVEIHIGPAVTEYELTVPAGTKVSRIVNINKERKIKFFLFPLKKERRKNIKIIINSIITI